MFNLVDTAGAGYTIQPIENNCCIVTFSTAEEGSVVQLVMSRQQLRDFMGLCLDMLAGPAS